MLRLACIAFFVAAVHSSSCSDDSDCTDDKQCREQKVAPDCLLEKRCIVVGGDRTYQSCLCTNQHNGVCMNKLTDDCPGNDFVTGKCPKKGSEPWECCVGTKKLE